MAFINVIGEAIIVEKNRQGEKVFINKKKEITEKEK
jgi:hypothetical protein